VMVEKGRSIRPPMPLGKEFQYSMVEGGPAKAKLEAKNLLTRSTSINDSPLDSIAN